MRIRFVILAKKNFWLLFFLSFFFYARGIPLSNQKWDMQLQGNNKTQDVYLENLVSSCLESLKDKKIADKKFFDELRQCVLNSKLFSTVQVTQKKSNILVVKVEERWTLIPLPYGYADNNGELAGGLFLLETNLFGLGKTMGLGATFASHSNSYFLMYGDKNLFFSPWRAFAFAQYSNGEISQNGFGEKIHNEFREERTTLTGLLGYNFNDNFTVNFSTAGTWIRTRHSPGYLLNPGNSDQVYLGLGLRFQDQNYKFYFQEGPDIRADFNSNVYRSDVRSFAQNLKISAKLTKPTFWENYVTVFGQAGFSTATQQTDLFRLGVEPGFRGIFRRGLWATRYANAVVEYGVPIASFQYGTWTAAAFSESGYTFSQPIGSHRDLFYQTFGGGTYFYLKKIALPGFGLEMGWNSQFSPFFFAFRAGFSR